MVRICKSPTIAKRSQASFVMVRNVCFLLSTCFEVELLEFTEFVKSLKHARAVKVADSQGVNKLSHLRGANDRGTCGTTRAETPAPLYIYIYL